jgi:hypothetical protein
MGNRSNSAITCTRCPQLPSFAWNCERLREIICAKLIVDRSGDRNDTCQVPKTGMGTETIRHVVGECAPPFAKILLHSCNSLKSFARSQIAIVNVRVCKLHGMPCGPRFLASRQVKAFQGRANTATVPFRNTPRAKQPQAKAVPFEGSPPQVLEIKGVDPAPHPRRMIGEMLALAALGNPRKETVHSP